MLFSFELVFDATDGVLNLALYFVGLALRLQLGVTDRLADRLGRPADGERPDKRLLALRQFQIRQSGSAAHAGAGEELEKIDSDVLLLFGEHSEVYDAAAVAALLSKRPWFSCIPGLKAGHPPSLRTDEQVDLITRYLAE